MRRYLLTSALFALAANACDAGGKGPVRDDAAGAAHNSQASPDAGELPAHPATPQTTDQDSGLASPGEVTGAVPGDTKAGPAPDQTDAGALLPTEHVTYYRHAKPILDAKCVRCHVAGTVAPFSLDTYEQAKTFAQPSIGAINAGKMPPWKFDPACNDYVGDFSLSVAEKQLLNAWVDGGTLEGDPKDQGPKLDIGESGLSRVDLTLQLPEPYAPAQHPDEYRCFPVPWPKDKTAFMTGFHAVPGNPKIVHHVEVYHVPKAEAAKVQQLDDADSGPGYTCFGGPGAGTGTIGGWAPGGPGYDYPDGIGIQIEPGAVIVVQVHYNTFDTMPAPDQTKVELKVDDTAIKGGYNFWTNAFWSIARQMPIPAGDSDKKYTWTADPTTQLTAGQPLMLYQLALHMHNIGRTGYMKIKAKASGETCLLKISDWDFHWQSGVRLQKPILINPGDTIEMQCGFDNSAAHQALGPDGKPTPPKDMNWGENTSDEMCLGILLWGPKR